LSRPRAPATGDPAQAAEPWPGRRPRTECDSALAHWYLPAPNHGPRRGGARADLLLLHYTGTTSALIALDWLTRRESRVSCHYLVDECGHIVQMVAESARAWHAGVSHWAAESDINSRSIGIEIHNPGHQHGCPAFPDVQMQAVTQLCRDVVARNAIPPERVLAHSDVAPARKLDPGERFDWHRLHLARVGHWVAPAALGAEAGLGPGDDGPAVHELQRQLQAYGYAVPQTGQFDTATEQVVRAFQRHWRPARVDGRFDTSTADTLRRLQLALDAHGSG